MSTRVLVVFYSLRGHVEALARAVGAGAESVRNTAVRIRRFPDPDARPVRSAVDEVFTSTASIHGGQESTILTTLIPLLHFGMIFVGTPYVQNPQIMTADAIGGSPYGPSTVAGPDGSRPVADVELLTARNLGVRLARVASATKIIRVTSIRGQDIESSEYDT